MTAKWEPTEEQAAGAASVWNAHRCGERAATEAERRAADVAVARAALHAAVGPEVGALRAEVARLREQPGIAAEAAVVEAVRAWQACPDAQRRAIDIDIDGKHRRRCGLPDEGVPAVVVAACGALEVLADARVRPATEVAAEAAAAERERCAALCSCLATETREHMHVVDTAAIHAANAADACAAAIRALGPAPAQPPASAQEQCATWLAAQAADYPADVFPAASDSRGAIAGTALREMLPRLAERLRRVELDGAPPPAPTHYHCSRCERPLGIDRNRCNSDPDGEPICTRCLFTDWPEEPAELAKDQPPRWQRCPVCAGAKQVDQPISGGATGTAASPVPCPVCGGTGLVLAPPAQPPAPDRYREALRGLVEHHRALSGTRGHRLGCECSGSNDSIHSCASFEAAWLFAQAALEDGT